VVWIPSSNRYFVGLIVPEILWCKDFGVLAWNCLFTPFLVSFWGIFSPDDVTHRPDPRKDRPWAETRHLSIQRNDQFDGSTWGQDGEKNSITTKVTRVLYFPYLGGRPRWADSILKLHGGWPPRRNHVCRVSNWNLHRLRFYRGSNFRFPHWF